MTETPEISDRVTVLVFKDNYAARSFQIPLRWISRFGLLLGATLCVTLVSIFLTVKYYRVARRSDPSHVEAVEQELSDLKVSYKELAAKAVGSDDVKGKLLPIVAPSAAVKAIAAAPAPTVTVTVTPTFAQPAAPAGSVALFQALPPKTLFVNGAGTSVPISVIKSKVTWRGSRLRVKIGLQYTRDDKGTQQGRIVVLARDSDVLFAYPQGVLNGTDGDHLISPERGEFFSMSRYREVNTEFGPFRSPGKLKEIELLVFNPEGQVLIYDKIKPQAYVPPVRPSAKPAPTTPAAPAAGAPAVPPVPGATPAAGGTP